MRFFSSIGVYGLIAFVIGFALMAYEMVASRILAPRIGSSVYVWTSIIGVIIAALSAGYAAGGYLADRRVKPADIALLLLACSATVLLTLISTPPTLAFVGQAFSDPRMQGVAAAAWLFMPTSFLLGTISPYLARLKTSSVSTTGTTIASLSALNAVGGILGTFMTGFVFFAYIGSSQSLLLISLLLFAASWTVQPRSQWHKRLGFTAALAVLSVIALASVSSRSPRVVDSIDTPSARYEIIDTNFQGRRVRALTTGPGGLQSGIVLGSPDELAFSYTQKLAALIAEAPEPASILILGGGTFTLPEHLAGAYPEAAIDTIEIDAQLVPIAERYFDYSNPGNITIIAEDARAFLNKNQRTYDIIVVDVYSDTLIPPTVATIEYADRLKHALKPDGVVLANIIGSDSRECRGLLRSLHATYLRALPYWAAYPLADASLQTEQNIIFAYSGKRLDWLPESSVRLAPGEVFTDDYAPVEHRKLLCSTDI